MAKHDPIISEFESDEAEAAYDKWFRAEVEAALAEEGPNIPHDEVMRGVREIIEGKRRARGA